MRLQSRVVAIFVLIGVSVSAESQPLYPVVGEATQRVRDIERRMILQEEMQTALGTLAKAQAAYNAAPTEENNEVLHRHDEDVKALQRELNGANGKVTRPVSRVIVRATRSSINSTVGAKSSANFWDPYNRAPEHTEFLTAERREIP